MIHIKIRRPTIDDKEELFEFFNLVMVDTYMKEGIEYMVDTLEEEIQSKKRYLENDLKSNGELRYFLIAEDRESIVGTIEYGPVSDLINISTNGEYEDLYEIGTVFVRPDYQKQGVATQLLDAIFQLLKNKGLKEVCLDSGYANAQVIWTKKFGQANYLLKDYWGEGMDHMIWKIDLSRLFKKF